MATIVNLTRSAANAAIANAEAAGRVARKFIDRSKTGDDRYRVEDPGAPQIVGDYTPRSDWRQAREAWRHRQNAVTRESSIEATDDGTIADSVVGVEATMREAMHVIDSACTSTTMQRNILDALCSALQRQLRRTEAAMAKEAEGAPEDGSLPPELESVRMSELSDRMAQFATDVAALRRMLDGATAAYDEILGEPWVPASQSSRVYHPSVALATEIALGNVTPSTPERQGYRVVVTGAADDHDRDLVRSYLDRMHAKHGHRLWIYTGDRPTGVDGTVTDWARRHRVAIRQFALDFNRHGKDAGFRRNAIIVGHAPNAVLAFGGTSLVGDLVGRALKDGISAFAPIAPAGWTVGDDLRPVRQAAPSQARGTDAA